jgi:hypothetical protein
MDRNDHGHSSRAHEVLNTLTFASHSNHRRSARQQRRQRMKASDLVLLSAESPSPLFRLRCHLSDLTYHRDTPPRSGFDSNQARCSRHLVACSEQVARSWCLSKSSTTCRMIPNVTICQSGRTSTVLSLLFCRPNLLEQGQCLRHSRKPVTESWSGQVETFITGPT